jgi:two-component system, OmpR family, response regulator
VRVLVVEDELRMAGLIRRGLVREGLAADVAEKGEDALWMSGAHEYDVIVLDVMLPGIDGFETCRRLRKNGIWAPVLMLTARDSVEDRVAGLDTGADDYLVKPFAYDELLARVRALLRRRPPSSSALTYADLVLDLTTRDVVRGERAVELTALEFELLYHFLRHPRQVYTRQQLLDAVWGGEHAATSNVVDVYVGYLRAKLESGGESRLLQTVRGVGYTLRDR